MGTRTYSQPVLVTSFAKVPQRSRKDRCLQFAGNTNIIITGSGFVGEILEIDLIMENGD